MPSPDKKRPAMLGSVIRERIAPVLRECPRECGIVSITQVDVSADYSFATVLISALQEPEVALRYLESRKHDMQRSLSGLQMRKTPRLRFRSDRVTMQGDRIDQLLREAEEQEMERERRQKTEE